MKSAADGCLPEELFEQTAVQKPGSHEGKGKAGGKVEEAINLGMPEELERYHGKDIETGTGRGKV